MLIIYLVNKFNSALCTSIHVVVGKFTVFGKFISVTTKCPS